MKTPKSFPLKNLPVGTLLFKTLSHSKNLSKRRLFIRRIMVINLIQIQKKLSMFDYEFSNPTLLENTGEVKRLKTSKIVLFFLKT